MSRSSRRNKKDLRLRELEADFVARLVAALHECANGRWGLFGHNEHLMASLRSPAPELLLLGDTILELRSELGLTEPFAPYEKFVQYRSHRGANVAGEPRTAEKFLLEFDQRRTD